MPRPCPLCTSVHASPAFPYETRWSARSFYYERCKACGCTFVDPTPTLEEFDQMYSTEEYHDVHYTDESSDRHRSSIAFLKQTLNPGRGARLLDFGCGNGSFMRAANAAGLVAFGVEQSERGAANMAARTGLDIASMSSRISNGATFDVIHLGDVLEHLPDPEATFRELEKLLSPGGAFFVEGPLQAHSSVVYYAAAAFGATRRAIGRSQPGTSPPTHLLLATASSQRLFFTNRLGYRLLAFDISEDGWPYLHKGAPSRRFGEAVRRAIGHVAVWVARAPGLQGRIGNRFMAITLPPV